MTLTILEVCTVIIMYYSLARCLALLVDLTVSQGERARGLHVPPVQLGTGSTNLRFKV